MPEAAAHPSPLFRPFAVKSLGLPNRIVMSPMGRAWSPGGVPHENYVGYFQRRALGGTGLLMTESSAIPHTVAALDTTSPHLYGEAALASWRRVLDAVHGAGGRLMPQLFHAGMQRFDGAPPTDLPSIGPSGVKLPFPATPTGPGPAEVAGKTMTQADIDSVIDAYARCCEIVQKAGFDGAEIHGGHGFLIDQFLWPVTNRRTDGYGGSAGQRARFAAEIVRECRRRVGADFPLFFRISQFKITDYQARIATTPAELAALVEPLADAGVDLFDCSQRRFWVPEFPDEHAERNLAAWIRKFTGRPTMTCGSVGVETELYELDLNPAGGNRVAATNSRIALLEERLERGDFDLVALGRSLIADADWARKLREGRSHEFRPFAAEQLMTLE